MPAPYATRLRLEGTTLAAAGLAGSAALLRWAPQARRWPLSTVGQLVLVAALLATRGPRTVETWIERAEPVDDASFTGEPTPLWHVPVPMLVLAALVKAAEPVHSRAGWDASLRVTGGAALAGAAQATLLAARVRAAEERTGRTFFRLPGSRLGTGTRLGFRRDRP